jgi:LysM repeat protein
VVEYRRQFIERAIWASGALLGSSWMTGELCAETIRVKKGDTLYGLAKRYGTSVDALKSANGLRGNMLDVGQKLTLPSVSSSGMSVYRVERGDTLARIADREGSTVGAIRSANGLRGDIIYPGQRLKVPVGVATGKDTQILAKKKLFVGPAQRKIDISRLQERRWKHIIMHHSGTPTGNGKIFDYYHRRIRRMENGLAYHFVIGNGSDSGDGEIEVAERWRKQIKGGHVKSEAYNKTSVGICLVGNFQKSRPTRKQVAAAIELVDHLKNDLLDGRPDLLLHREIQKTICPGRYFPAKGMHNIFS